MIRDVAPSSASGAGAGVGRRLVGGGPAGSSSGGGGSVTDEADVATAQPDVDRAGRQLAGDLLGRRGQRAEQGEPERRLERPGEPLGERARLVAADLCGRHELAAQLVDVGGEVHDDMVTSL